MKDIITNRLARLLCVKSLVTLLLTAAFVTMALRGEVGQDFMTVYTVIIAFYFGTQLERTRSPGRDINWRLKRSRKSGSAFNCCLKRSRSPGNAFNWHLRQ